jgi:hypothetical protein
MSTPISQPLIDKNTAILFGAGAGRCKLMK